MAMTWSGGAALVVRRWITAGSQHNTNQDGKLVCMCRLVVCSTAIQYNTVRSSAYGTVWCHTVAMVQYGKARYSTQQYGTVRYGVK